MAYESNTGLHVHNQYGPRSVGGGQGVHHSDDGLFYYVIDQASQGLTFLFPRGGGVFVTGVDTTFVEAGTVTALTIGGLNVFAATLAAPIHIPGSNTGEVVQTGMTSGRVIVNFKKEAGYEADILPAFPNYGEFVPVTGVTVNPTTKTVAAAATFQVVATVAPGTANQGVVWYSSDLTKATVTSDGVVTAVATGSATISARSVSDNTKVATCAVTIS